jgi:hypothetical protein
MPEMEKKEVIPSASRLITSLRNIGYEFVTAVADLVDNSMEAGSTQVDIDIVFKGTDSYVRIADNGTGMNNEQLQEAMRFGSARDYEKEADLGKFGLGLKTASFSQCRRFTVTSRSKKYSKNINAYYWDLDLVQKTDKWDIIKIDPQTINNMLEKHLSKSSGTVIFWEKLDRILELKNPNSENGKKRLISMCRDLEEHLAMVFHRFLAGEVPGRRLRIYLNGNNVNPWDPYCRNETMTKIFDPIRIEVESEEKSGSFTLDPYILPQQEAFSSMEAFRLAGGPKKWNRQQGFYIYRANRMIQCGGWLGIRTIDEHLKLARIALNLTPHLDDVFKINISKMRVTLPSKVRENIEEELKNIVKQANIAYRKKDNVDSPIPKPVKYPVSSPPKEVQIVTKPADKENENQSEKNCQPPNKLWSLDDIHCYLNCLASPEEIPIIDRLFMELRNDLEGRE